MGEPLAPAPLSQVVQEWVATAGWLQLNTPPFSLCGVPEVGAKAVAARAERGACPAWPGAWRRWANGLCSSSLEFQVYPEAAAEAAWLAEAGAEPPQHLRQHR